MRLFFLASVVAVFLCGIPSKVARYYWVLGLLGLLLSFPARTRSAGKNSLMALAVFGFALVGGDVYLRGRLPPEMYPRPGPFLLQRWPAWPKLARFYPMSGTISAQGDLTQYGPPESHSPVRQIQYHFDEHGLPNAPGALARETRLVMLGDSFVVGGPASFEQGWARRIEELTGRNTYAVATPGSPWHALLNLKIMRPKLKLGEDPVVVWTIFAGNDLTEDYYAELEPPPLEGFVPELEATLFSWRNRSSIRHLLGHLKKARKPAPPPPAPVASSPASAASSPVAPAPSTPDASPAAPAAPPPTEPGKRLEALVSAAGAPPVLPRPLGNGETLLFYTQYIRRYARNIHEVKGHPHFAALPVVMDEMVRYCAAEGLRLQAVLIPSKPHVYRWILEGADPSVPTPPDLFLAEAAAMLEARGVPVIDLAVDLQREARRLWSEEQALLWYTDDTHWNERGHALAATLVAEVIDS